MILWLGRGAERAQRAAVEAVHHGDDLVPAGFAVEPSHLNRRFHCFRAAVAETALSAPAGPFAQSLAKFALFLRVPCVRDMDEPADLLADGGYHARRTMPDQVATPAREEIEIAIALGVPDARSLAAHETDGIARVIADDAVLEQVDG